MILFQKFKNKKYKKQTKKNEKHMKKKVREPQGEMQERLPLPYGSRLPLRFGKRSGTSLYATNNKQLF